MPRSNSKTRKNRATPHVFYESVTTNWSSTPKGKAHGTRNTVTIRNGKGYKIKQALNAQAKVLETQKRALKPAEIKAITGGTFVPGLWRNCTLKNC